MGSFAKLCEMQGLKEDAAGYQAEAESMAREWVPHAADGDHTRLSFDQPGTWLQKYNLVWDDVLDLKLFPAEIKADEVAFYLKIQNRYGIPLDSRMSYTKLDWVLWSAALADNQEDFRALMSLIYHYLNGTPERYPMPDRYWTRTAQWRGFCARSVVGRVFMPLLKAEVTREE